jgi:hypothetical protein
LATLTSGEHPKRARNSGLARLLRQPQPLVATPLERRKQNEVVSAGREDRRSTEESKGSKEDDLSIASSLLALLSSVQFSADRFSAAACDFGPAAGTVSQTGHNPDRR